MVKDGIRFEIMQPHHRSKVIPILCNRIAPMASALGIADHKIQLPYVEALTKEASTIGLSIACTDEKSDELVALTCQHDYVADMPEMQ